MLYLTNFPRLNTVILLLFFGFWLYSEIQEGRDAIEWKSFIHSGGRFTAEEGKALEARIEAMEAKNDVPE